MKVTLWTLTIFFSLIARNNIHYINLLHKFGNVNKNFRTDLLHKTYGKSGLILSTLV